jgi:CheY-like chemotaxis protein
MDGWAVLGAIKQDPDLAGIPIIMATMVDEKARGFASGVADYLLKPIDRTRLLAVLKERLTPSASAKPISSAVAPPPKREPAERPRRVLVVEDDGANRSILIRTIRKEGWEGAEADTGLRALAAIAQNPPDLILLDLSLPELNGFGVLRELRARGADHIPVIAITARDLSREERKLLEGVRRVLQKGNYNRNELLREMRAQLATRVAPPTSTAPD